MNWESLSTNQGFSARSRSLYRILDRAIDAAKAGKVQISVFCEPLYVDEHDTEGQHVYCPTVAAGIMYPKANTTDAVISPSGSVFFTNTSQVLEVVALIGRKQLRVDLKVEGLEPEKPICPNCGQWQHPHPKAKGGYDCFHECVSLGFAPPATQPKGEGRQA